MIKAERIIFLMIAILLSNSADYGFGHRNWGDVKGVDSFYDVCVVLNKTTSKFMRNNKLMELTPSTRNKLYVAITRARGNVYLIEDKMLKI